MVRRGMPKGTPREAIDKMNAAINKALADPKLRAAPAELGGSPIPGTPGRLRQDHRGRDGEMGEGGGGVGATVD